MKELEMTGISRYKVRLTLNWAEVDKKWSVIRGLY